MGMVLQRCCRFIYFSSTATLTYNFYLNSNSTKNSVATPALSANSTYSLVYYTQGNNPLDTGNVAGSGGSWSLTLVGNVGIASGNNNVIPLLPNVQMIALTTTTQPTGLVWNTNIKIWFSFLDCRHN